jgi:carbon monoxide dehydrogenase subunit G
MALSFENAFEVPLGIDDAWRVLLDVPRVARCLPGAELIEIVDERTFKGAVNVKVGPVALAFGGTASLEEIDEASHSVRIKGAGNEAKGRGRASADFAIRLEVVGEACTRITARSDVTLSGAVAQYGRGIPVMKAVADEIIARFVQNLEAEIADGAVSGTQLSAAGVLWNAGRRMLKRD